MPKTIGRFERRLKRDTMSLLHVWWRVELMFMQRMMKREEWRLQRGWIWLLRGCWRVGRRLTRRMGSVTNGGKEWP